MPVTQADIPRLAKDASAIYRKWQPQIDKYHGGVPLAQVAVRMKVESGGIMDLTPGGGSLEEIGLLSVTKQTEERFGVPDRTRYTVDGNVFLGCLRYNVDTQIFIQRYGMPGSPGALFTSFADAFIAGQLIAGIGTGAANYLFKDAPRGISYERFTKWVADEAEAGRLPRSGPWGSQSLEKIVYRVRAFFYMNEAARLMESQYGISNRASQPVIPPLPPSVSGIVIPKGVRITRASSRFGTLFGLTIGGVLAWWAIKKRWFRFSGSSS